MPPSIIRHKLIELVAELRADATRSAQKMKEPIPTTRKAWYQGVRDAKQADANKVAEILDAIDRTKGQ